MIGHKIIREVAARHGLPIERVKKGGGRKAPVVLARQEAMALLRRHFGLRMVGRLLGGFDNTTVLHGIRRHAARKSSYAGQVEGQMEGDT